MQQVQTGTDSRAMQTPRSRARQTVTQEARRDIRPEVLPEIVFDHTRADLRSRYQEILDECRTTGATVRIAEDGVEELVVMSPETFRRYAVMELRALLLEGVGDDLAGRLIPMEEVFAQLEEDMRNGTL